MRQGLVIQAHAFHITEFNACCIHDKTLARLQKNFALGELSDADFGSLQVSHDAHFAPGANGRLAHHLRAVDVILGGPMAEIEPNHVHTGPDHPLQKIRITGSWAKSCNDFGSATRHVTISV